MSRWRDLVERLLPWYFPIVERKRDAYTARVVRRSEVARGRAGRVIEEYRQAEAEASQVGTRASQVVAEFRDKTEEAKVAGEAVIEELEKVPVEPAP